MDEGTETLIANSSQDKIFTRYLLGDLTEPERVRLEEGYFTDDEAFERLLVVKGELIDAYARGGLKGREHELFEQHFLATRPRRQRLREATELIEFSTETAARTMIAGRDRETSRWSFLLPDLRPRRAGAFAIAAVLTLVALVGLWAFFKSAESRRTERAARTISAPESVSERPPDSASPLNNKGAPVAAGTSPGVSQPTDNTPAVKAPARTSPSPTRLATVLLTPVLTRDGGRANTLIIRPGTTAARLRLAFTGGDYRRYIAVLQTVEGQSLWRGAASRGEQSGAGHTVVVNVPATVFRRQDYIITLSGVTAGGETKELHEYFLTIRK